jgi:hypothetical protein
MFASVEGMGAKLGQGTGEIDLQLFDRLAFGQMTYYLSNGPKKLERFVLGKRLQPFVMFLIGPIHKFKRK